MVDENERMYTWGSSPQALRLANQIKRRANAKQKIEEHQRREMSRRFEATIVSTAPSTLTAASEEESTIASENSSANASVVIPTVTISSAALDADETITPSIVKDEIVSGVATIVADIDNLPLDEHSIATEDATNNINIEIIDDEVVDDVPILKTTTTTTNITTHATVSGLDKLTTKNADVTDATSSNTNVPAAPPTSSTQQPQTCGEIDPCEHMSPQLVDTSEVAGQILQASFKIHSPRD